MRLFSFDPGPYDDDGNDDDSSVEFDIHHQMLYNIVSLTNYFAIEGLSW